jgi:hypothetical protein
MLWKFRIFRNEGDEMSAMKWISTGLALALAATSATAVPTILHDPVQVAQKGNALGVRATVRDDASPVESVSLFYATSRGSTPFRASMASAGAGAWFATIPGHMIGPGSQLFYYIQAENAEGETRDTDWVGVRVVDVGVAPKDIPTAEDAARQARAQDAARAAAQAPASGGVAPSAPAAVPPPPERNRYLVPAAIVVGGALAVGGAIAIAGSSDSGGGGGGGGDVTNANFGGSYSYCLDPGAATSLYTVCDSGLVNVYVREGQAEVVGLWDAEVFSTPLNGSVFTVAKSVPNKLGFPQSYLIVSGEIRGDVCTGRINGYSQDPEMPGNYSGEFDTTKR